MLLRHLFFFALLCFYLKPCCRGWLFLVPCFLVSSSFFLPFIGVIFISFIALITGVLLLLSCPFPVFFFCSSVCLSFPFSFLRSIHPCLPFCLSRVSFSNCFRYVCDILGTFIWLPRLDPSEINRLPKQDRSTATFDPAQCAG